MKKLKYLIVLCVTALFIFSQFSFNGKDVELPLPSKLKTEYIVVFVIDGPRYTETFGDTSYTYIPHLGKELKKEGVFFNNFMNNGVTHTTPGHTAMMTGVYQSIKNDGSQLPKNPSFMQYYLKEKSAPKESCWVISSKGKLHVLANTKDKDWKNEYVPSKFCGPDGNDKDYVGDSYTWGKINDIYFKNKPKLCLINLLGVDVNGHQNNWQGYLDALKQCDEYAFEFWRKIQSDSVMKDKTTIFFTNDHGRHLNGHKNGFVEHGDKCMGCRHISLLAIGPDFKKGVEVCNERELIDISKTISYMFQFQMPTCEGKIIEELFR